MDIQVDPKKVSLYIGLVVVGLTLAHIVGQFFIFYLGHTSVFGLVPLFDLNGEHNVPTLYAAGALFFCAVLLAIIAAAIRRNGGAYWPHWAALALIFLYLSLDEALLLHERFVQRRIVSGFGLDESDFVFYIAWIIPFGILLIIFVLAYVKFLLHLPRQTALLFIIAGAIFVAGAIGLEAAAGIHHFLYGYTEAKKQTNVAYAVLLTAEEFLEMTGIVIFIYALLSYIDSELKDLRLKVVSS
jgi:hypothetical protein